MDFRIILASLLFLAGTATAQQDPPPDATPEQAPKKQAQAPSSATIIEQLRKEKERLQREIDYAKARAENANKMLAQKLARVGQEIPSIDAGTNRPRPATSPGVKKARLMTDPERNGLRESVMMTVNGVELFQNEFDDLMFYLRSLDKAGDESMHAKRVLLELIRIKSVQAMYPENSAEGTVSDVYAKMNKGKSMPELVKSYGSVLGASEDGTVEVTRNSFLGPQFEQIAFGLDEGKVSRPFRNVFGFVVFRADQVTKGAEPGLDKVKGYAVQVKYDGDEQELNLAQAAAARGQADILVRDQKTLDMMPALYRPESKPQGAPANTDDPNINVVATLKARLKAIETRIAKASSSEELTPEQKAELKSLIQQKAQLEEAIQSVKQTTGQEAEVPVVPARVVEKPKKPDGDVKKLNPKK